MRMRIMACSSASLKIYESLFLFFILTWTLTSSNIYKSVMWTTNNPYFQNHNKSGNYLKSFCHGGDLLMKVNLKTILPIICPFEDLIMQPMESQPSSGVLYENLWIVYDKKSYDTCIINETLRIKKHSDRILQNKILHKCNKPAPLDNYFYRIDFSKYSPVPSDLYFEGNKTYYFLATSDGTLGSLDQKRGGHCDNDGDKEIRMKFKVYVCGTNEYYTDPKCEHSKIGEFICERPESPTSPPDKKTTTSSITTLPSVTTTSIVTTSPSVTATSSVNISTTSYTAVGVLASFLSVSLLVIIMFIVYIIWTRNKTNSQQAKAYEVGVRNVRRSRSRWIQFDDVDTFTIGDGKRYNGKYNTPLPPATRLIITVRAVTKAQNGGQGYGEFSSKRIKTRFYCDS